MRNRPTLKLVPGETKNIELTLEKGVPVRGKYIPKDGKMPNPLPKLGLQLQQRMDFNPKPISADGAFEFFVPGPGEYQLLIETRKQRDSYLPHPALIKVPSEQAVDNLEIRGE